MKLSIIDTASVLFL